MNKTSTNNETSSNFLGLALSVFLGLYVIDGLCALTSHLLSGSGSGVFNVLASSIEVVFLLLGLGLYSSMGWVANLPKRYLLPLLAYQVLQSLVGIYLGLVHVDALFNNAALFRKSEMILAVGQVLVWLGVIRWIRGDWRWTWPLFPAVKLANRPFNWRTFTIVHLGLVVALIGMLAYSGWCLAVAVDRFSAGFMVLHWDHLGLRSKTFVREDGKTVQLTAMMHIGQPSFYQQVAQSIPPEASVLLEGVTDKLQVLTTKLDYGPLAEHYHLATQKANFLPPSARSRRADVDLSEFQPTTIKLLNALAKLASLGDFSDADALSILQECLQDRHVDERVIEDLLLLRNRHVLAELDQELTTHDVVVLPWGAAHMPGLSEAVLKEGFHLKSVQEFPVIYFH